MIPPNELTQYDGRGDARKFFYALEKAVINNEPDTEKTAIILMFLVVQAFVFYFRDAYARRWEDIG